MGTTVAVQQMEPEPFMKGLSNAEQFAYEENIRNKVLHEDGDRWQDWPLPCQNLEDEQDATPEICHNCDRDITNLHQHQCRRCAFTYCGVCVWFCPECHWTICVGCACGCEVSDTATANPVIDPCNELYLKSFDMAQEAEKNEG